MSSTHKVLSSGSFQLTNVIWVLEREITRKLFTHREDQFKHPITRLMQYKISIVGVYWVSHSFSCTVRTALDRTVKIY
jgi:hypothetical protein